MKYFKLFMAITGAFLWCAFAVFMNDMNSASDKDHSTGLVQLSLVGVLAALWLVFWAGVTWFRLQETRMSGHLTIVIAILWTNSLVLEIGLPWLSYLAGWMWPVAMTAWLQALLIGSAVILHLRIQKPLVNNGAILFFLGSSFLFGASIALYVYLTEFGSTHVLPYKTQIFQSFS